MTQHDFEVIDFERLNCMNYHVYDHRTGDHWYACNGLESLKVYAEISDWSYDSLCYELSVYGEATIMDQRDHESGQYAYLTLTMI